MSNMKDLAINNRITLQSHSINALKVLMILFVIYIHMNPTSERCGEVAMWWHSVNIVAVPVFFIISGYFFFYQVSEFTCDSYRKKLKKRMRSLLLPYFLWNLLPVLLITGGNLYSILLRGKSLEALDDFYRGLWSEGLYHIWWDKTSGTMPFDSPLWYIRDLMMVCVFSPLLYQAIKRVGWVFPGILVLLYIMGLWPNINGFSSTAFCFFSIGATYALKGKLLIDGTKKQIIGLMVIVAASFIGTNLAYMEIVMRTFIFTSALLWLILSGKVPEFILKKVNILIPVSSIFFIYAIHNTFVLANVSKLLLKVVDEPICFYLSPIMTMGVCLTLYFVVKTVFPKMTLLLCGGR